MTAAVVLGGGFAGVLAAVVLARHVERVTLVEGGRYPAGPVARPELPQGYHSHVLVTGGMRALEALLPGTEDALYAHGAHRRRLTGDALILSADGWFRRHDTDTYLISGSRWLVDQVVRQQALVGDTMSVREGTHVLGLLGTRSRVTGVLVRRPDSGTEAIRADLVVDATGRRSRAVRWLAGIGAYGVAEATIDPGLAYSTRVYRAPTDLAGTIPAIMIHPRPEPSRPSYGATLFPIEDDRWIVTLTGTRDSAPPTDEQGFTDCAYSLRSPLVAELMAAATPAGGVRPYRATANRRRYFERGPRPDGFLVVGDALVAVNPVHSHGMSVAALSALRLADHLDRHGTEPTVLPGVQVAVAAEADRSWRMATGVDRPAKRPATPFERLILARRSRAVLSSPALMAEMFRAQALLLPARAKVAVEAAPPQPALSADEAIAQYPGIATWWLSNQVGRQS